MKFRTIASLLSALTFLGSSASLVHAAVPVELDGAITAVKLNNDGSATLTVMGVTVTLPKGTPVTSPSAMLTLQQLADTTPLPGRTEAGFVGGTAFISGTGDPATGSVTASDVFVEAAKHIVVGFVTSGEPLTVNNMPVSFSKDPRLPSAPPKNKYGFPVKVSALKSGTPVVVEGYWDGKSFRAFSTAINGKAEVMSIYPQVAIVASKSWERTPNNEKGDDVEIRGSVTMSHAPNTITTQTIRIFRVDKGVDTMLGDAIANRDPEDPDYGTFNFKVTTPPSSDAILGSAPTRFKAVNISAATIEADTTEFVR
ncbi:hypothetical protein FEM03_22835 [Phragmitibacter flavus]|uniref:DUF5666 domain-containing protein n=1 Tax=Phragmitibacter flavus TaxID=2576071 RepID=A0A5R8K7X8_9BACT|nr:hypothetical protein [Phragmitibacter flavus]TLD68442.1 hypothetical protein FEM03_22835 [Phragmitibacter flavus]